MPYIDTVSLNGTAVDLQDSGARTNEGTLANLTTTEKTNLVGAINEVNAAASDLKSHFDDCLSIDIDVNADSASGDGHFVNASNDAIADSANFAMTAPISVKKGQTVNLTAKGYSTSVGMIATCNADNTSRKTVVASVDSDPHTYTYLVTEDGYVVCSYNKTVTHKIALTVDYYKYAPVLDDNMVFAGTKAVNLTIAADKYYVAADTGAVGSSNAYQISDTLVLEKGQTISLTTTAAAAVGVINRYDPYMQTYECLVHPESNTEATYTYTATEKEYIRLCKGRSSGYACSITTPNSRITSTDDYARVLNYIDEGEESITPTVALTKYFVNANQHRVDAGNNFNITDSIYLYKGQMIVVNAKGYSTSVGMISKYYPDSDTYEAVVASIDSDVHDYVWVATENCYVRCSYNKSETITIKRITKKPLLASVIAMQDDIDGVISAAVKNRVEYPQIFDSIVCIGDSLTLGYSSSSATDPLTKNYPHALAKLTGATVTVKGHGGYNATEVWEGYIENATDLSTFDCAIIYLGTNDGLTDTVSTDCNASDYTQNANTYTGSYGKIIGKIKADAPNCQIFVVAGPNEYIRRETTMNPAVRDLAEFYGVGLADISDCILSDNGLGTSIQRYRYRPSDSIHYNTLGYLTLANVIYDAIAGYIAANLRKYATAT